MKNFFFYFFGAFIFILIGFLGAAYMNPEISWKDDAFMKNTPLWWWPLIVVGFNVWYHFITKEKHKEDYEHGSPDLPTSLTTPDLSYLDTSDTEIKIANNQGVKNKDASDKPKTSKEREKCQ